MRAFDRETDDELRKYKSVSLYAAALPADQWYLTGLKRHPDLEDVQFDVPFFGVGKTSGLLCLAFFDICIPPETPSRIYHFYHRTWCGHV